MEGRQQATGVPHGSPRKTDLKEMGELAEQIQKKKEQLNQKPQNSPWAGAAGAVRGRERVREAAGVRVLVRTLVASGGAH